MYGIKAYIEIADQSDLVATEKAVLQLEQSLGQVDILINNASINVLSPFCLTKWDDWWRLFDVNTKGVWIRLNTSMPFLIVQPLFITSLLLPKMRARNSGVVLQIASRAAGTSGAFGSAYGLDIFNKLHNG